MSKIYIERGFANSGHLSIAYIVCEADGLKFSRKITLEELLLLMQDAREAILGMQKAADFCAEVLNPKTNEAKHR